MKIGELAERTGTSTRQLRYYEEQGLLSPDRSDSNYREFGVDAIEQVTQIKSLVDAGIPTRVVRKLLPCLDGPTAQMEPHQNPEMAKMLQTERDRIQTRIQELTIARDRVECYLDRLLP